MYAKQKILVTGGASFIGSHLTEALLSRGADVTIVDDFSSGEWANIEHLASSIELVRGDLREARLARDVTGGKDIVFHLANIHGGRGFIETHPADVAQNFIIDGNVFRAAHLNGVKRVCFASSACAYPTSLQTAEGAAKARYLSEDMADPFKEGCALADGQYGWAKLMGEMALRAYHDQHGLRGVSCRLFTVYGPRENATHAIVAFIAKAMLRQDPFEVWGSGRQDRNFTYVSDVVEGMLLATEHVSDGRAVNIGTDEIVKIADAARIVREIIGHKPADIFYDVTKPEGVHARAADTRLQQDLLGWRPEVSFREGIARTIDWFLASRSFEEQIQRDLDQQLFERKPGDVLASGSPMSRRPER